MCMCVYTGYSSGVEEPRVGDSQFPQRLEVSGARRHVATQRIVVETAGRTRRSQGPKREGESGKARS